MSTTISHSAIEILQQVFGYESFRDNQLDIVNQVVGGGDALVLMPTGGGKSLCYQIPAMMRAGVGIVVSPLIALMQDQVMQLRQHGVNAAFVNSNQSAQQNWQIEQMAQNGELDLLYLAPERLCSEAGWSLLENLQVALFAIDEAHCVSQWGHDFRPEYTRLGQLVDRFPRVPRVALTATADDNTREDIKLHLRLEQASFYCSSFDRPNIQYRIEAKSNPRSQLLQFIKSEHPVDCGIIYCTSRKRTEETARWLCDNGVEALAYHAGMAAESRAANMQTFIEGERVVMVATIAFGMGIDKPDVRFVAHLDMPKSVESYYQETGRAGRDGLPANAWLVYGLQDAITFQQMLNDSTAPREVQQIERHKINAMLGLCEATDCRRKTLLNYFGEALHEPCNNCDTCLSPPQTWDASKAAQMALSAVYRTGQRFGTNYLIDVLLGKDNDRIKSLRHDGLSVYGIGGEHSDVTWRGIFRQLIARSYVITDAESRGGLRLAESARPVLRGEEHVSFRVETKPARRKKGSATTVVRKEQQQLWERLREVRRVLAKEQGVPAYVIFHDATLMGMMEQMPMTLSAMTQVSGVGASKLEKYGDAFLAVFNAPAAEVREVEPQFNGKSDSVLDRKVLAEINQGLSPDKLANKLNLESKHLNRSLCRLIRQGDIELASITTLDEGQLADVEMEIVVAFEENRGLQQVFDHFSANYSLDTLRLVQASVQLEMSDEGR